MGPGWQEPINHANTVRQATNSPARASPPKVAQQWENLRDRFCCGSSAQIWDERGGGGPPARQSDQCPGGLRG